MSTPIRIFISSTWQDLQPEREAVEKALHRMRSTAYAGMEYFGSRPETPREASLAEVDRSDVYVGIFAHRYGSGITEDEYRRARERGLPCLIYFKDENVPVPPAFIERDGAKAAKLEGLKEELKGQHTVSWFGNPHDLAAQVVADLHNQLGSAAPGQRGTPSTAGSTYNIHIQDARGVAIGDGASSHVYGGGSQGLGGAQAPAGSRSRRCQDLATNIEEALELIKQYEAQRRLASDPREARRAEHAVADLRSQLAAHEAEWRELGCS